MKKLLLILATGAFVAPALAQSSVVFTKGTQMEVPKQAESNAAPKFKPNRHGNTASKGTAGGNDWFYIPSILQSSSSKLYYNVNYPDSNVVYNGGSGNTNVFMHGMGHSFDPTDSAFYFETTTLGTVQDANELPLIRVSAGNAYTVDSVAFLSKYMRTTNDVDTLVLYTAVVKRTGTNPFGLYPLSFTGGARFTTALFDRTNNNLSDSIPASAYKRQEIILDAAFHGDTSANGFSNRTSAGIQLASPIVAAAGDVVLVYATFKSSVAHPLGTNVSAANTYRMYTWDLEGNDLEPKQNGNSYTAGLVATGQLKYYPYKTGFTYQGHQVLIPNHAYTTEGLFTDFAFHVTCATCDPVSVADVKGNILTANAYPNPASTEVSVPFTLKAAANVTVTLSNTVGQVISTQNVGNVATGAATFNVSALPNGVYFYTVEANGQRQTGRVAVSH